MVHSKAAKQGFWLAKLPPDQAQNTQTGKGSESVKAPSSCASLSAASNPFVVKQICC